MADGDKKAKIFELGSQKTYQHSVERILCEGQRPHDFSCSQGVASFFSRQFGLFPVRMKRRHDRCARNLRARYPAQGVHASLLP